jgi:hypothetical protein
MIHCDPDVMKQIQAMLVRNLAARRGGVNTDTGVEHGFIAYSAGGRIGVTAVVPGKYDEVTVTAPAGATVIAFFHTHPPSSASQTGFGNAVPSKFDRERATDNRIIYYTYTGAGKFGATQFNGRNATNPDGQPRVIAPASCPKKK